MKLLWARGEIASRFKVTQALVGVVFLVVMATQTDISRSSGRASALQGTFPADAHFMSPECIGPSLTQGWG